MNLDFDTTSPACELGFAIPSGPIPTNLPPASDITDVEFLAELIKQKALVNVDILNNILTKRAVSPAASVKTVVDALDANFKLSGLAAKGVAKELAAAVSITINIPTPEGKTGRTINVDSAVIEEIPSMRVGLRESPVDSEAKSTPWLRTPFK